MHKPLRTYLRLGLFLFWSLGLSAFAQTWNGSTSNNWSNPANWTGGLPSNNGTANVVFPTSSSQPYILDGSWAINTLTFSGNCLWDVQLSSNLSPAPILILQNGITDTIVSSLYPSQPVVISNFTIQLAQPQTWNIQTSASITSLITGSGGFTKTGTGTLVLAAGNTYSGGTIINAGSVSVADDTTFGGLAGNLQLNGGTLNFDQAPTSFSRNILLGASGGTIAAKLNLNLSSTISGSGPLTISIDTSIPHRALPNVTLSGNNSFTGGLTISNSFYNPDTPAYADWIVQVSGTSTSLGNGPVTLTAGTTVSINSAANLGNGYKIYLPSSTGLIVTSDSFDPSQLITSTSSQAYLELSGATYTRAMNMAAIGDGSLTLGVASGQTTVYSASSLQPGSGNIYRLGGNLDDTTSLLVISGNNNVLTGSASLLLSGPVNLLNSNNFTGGTTVSGSLGVGGNGPLGTGTVTLAGGSINAVNGASTLQNPIVIQSRGTFTGPLTINGPVNLGSGTPALFIDGSSVTFTNVISNGTLETNSGLSILQAANTFSALDLWEGGVSVASESNLGGSNTPISFDGFSTGPTGSGTLETTASFTLNNPISFHRPSSNAYANFQVDPGTTLTLNESIPSGTIYKSGTGSLIFSSSSSLTGSLYVYAGSATSSGSSLSNAYVQTDVGGTFVGSGQVNWLATEGGVIAPGGGTGAIVSPNLSVSSYYGASNLEFQFTQNGSPNYSNLSNSGNGYLSFATLTSGSIFSGNNVSIFLSTPTVQNSSSFKGAFFLQSTSAISSAFFNGVSFNFYVVSPTGTTTLNGQTFSPLNSSLYAVQQSWVAENGGQVCQFIIVSPLGSPPTIATLSAPYNFSFQSTGNPTFTVTSGSLPSGITLSTGGVLSGIPTAAGTYSFAITSTSVTGVNTIQDFTLNVQPQVASDTPTMPPWALFGLASLLFFVPARGLLGQKPADSVSSRY